MGLQGDAVQATSSYMLEKHTRANHLSCSSVLGSVFSLHYTMEQTGPYFSVPSQGRNNRPKCLIKGILLRGMWKTMQFLGMLV